MAAYVHLHWYGQALDNHLLITDVQALTLEDYRRRFPYASVAVVSIVRDPAEVKRMSDLLGAEYRNPRGSDDLLVWVYDFLRAEEEALDDQDPDSPV